MPVRCRFVFGVNIITRWGNVSPMMLVGAVLLDRSLANDRRKFDRGRDESRNPI